MARIKSAYEIAREKKQQAIRRHVDAGLVSNWIAMADRIVGAGDVTSFRALLREGSRQSLSIAADMLLDGEGEYSSDTLRQVAARR